MADPPVPVVTLARLRDHLAARTVNPDGVPTDPCVLVDLDTGRDTATADDLAAIGTAIDGAEVVAVGIARTRTNAALDGVLDALACTLTALPTAQRTCVTVPDVDLAGERLSRSVIRSPIAALTMRRLVQVTDRLPVREGLEAESAAYSMLLAGQEFARWRAGRERRVVPAPTGDAVVLDRVGDELRVRLDVPGRRNAYSRYVRDGLVEAFDLALGDDTIDPVVLSGSGPAFCSGGDLDEFGGSSDVASAHLIRLQRSAALRAHALGRRLQVRLHGACIGAGIEIPSFAGRVSARDGTVIALPELAMGLVPGAGGTVGITRRIGRWRCGWLHLSGERIGVDVALDWGLVDERG